MISTNMTCKYPKCKGYPTITYLTRDLCDMHWTKIADMPCDEAQELVGVPKKLRSIPLEKQKDVKDKGVGEITK